IECRKSDPHSSGVNLKLRRAAAVARSSRRGRKLMRASTILKSSRRKEAQSEHAPRKVGMAGRRHSPYEIDAEATRLAQGRAPRPTPAQAPNARGRRESPPDPRPR